MSTEKISVLTKEDWDSFDPKQTPAQLVAEELLEALIKNTKGFDSNGNIVLRIPENEYNYLIAKAQGNEK